MAKFIIYQLLPRVFGNTNEECVPNGSLSLNGSGKFNDISAEVLEDIKKLSVTHIWYTGVIEHATKTDFTEFGIKKDNPDIIKGEAGSPYAIKDYYDVNPYLACDVSKRMEEFQELVERTHNAGLKVIIDLVPNHLAREYNSDSTPIGIEKFGENDIPTFDEYIPSNNFYYLNKDLDLSKVLSGRETIYKEQPAKATGNDCFSSSPSINDWYETVKLNYGVDYLNRHEKYFVPEPKTWRMILEIVEFWISKGVDGFRCDMVEMVPVEFWDWLITQIKSNHKDVLFIGEVYNPALYDSYIFNGGFDYIYDKVGLYDNLKYITQTQTKAYTITNNWQSLGNKQDSMLNFLENHDEQRVASDFNIGDPFKAIPELVVSLMLNNAPYMIYFGQEVGERGMLQEGFSGLDGRTSIFDYCSAPSVVRLLNKELNSKECDLLDIYTRIFKIASENRAIYNGDMYDLVYANIGNTNFNRDTHYAFIRRSRLDVNDINSPDQLVVVAVDFSQPKEDSKISLTLPKHLFEFWSIEPKESIEIENLISGELEQISFTPNMQTELPLSSYGIAIYKLIK